MSLIISLLLFVLSVVFVFAGFEKTALLIFLLSVGVYVFTKNRIIKAYKYIKQKFDK